MWRRNKLEFSFFPAERVGKRLAPRNYTDVTLT